VVVIEEVEKAPRVVDIWSKHSNMQAADKLGEAPFKDFWSDDTKNNYREES
jgi:hypothetical protein